MARSFGRINVVNRDMFAYNIMLLGESGVGKTSMMAAVMKKFCKNDEYLVLQIGKEEGCKTIRGLSWEQINTWKEFTSFVDEVVKNREDWGTLKCVTLDTIDQLIDIGTPAAIRAWNSSQMGKKDFTPAVTLNQAWGGFGKGDEYLMNMILDQIWKLKSVGVSVFIVGHTRRRENVDPVSGMTYSTMSAAISLKNFESIKTKMDVVAIAYIDREMASKNFGKENIVTKEQKKINEVTSEARKVAFRSSAYVLDSKSRFADIVNEVPMNADAFVEAIQDAINKAADNEFGGSDTFSNPVSSSKAVPSDVTQNTSDEDEEIGLFGETEIDVEVEVEVEMEEPIDVSTLLAEIREAFKTADANTKKVVKSILTSSGATKLSEDLDVSVLQEIKNALV